MVLELLDCRLGDEDVDAALDCVQRNGEVGRVGREDGDGVAGLEAVNGALVRLGVSLVVGGEGVERRVESVVHFRDVLGEMLADRGELLAVDAYHTQLVDFAAAAEVEERQAYDADFLVGTGSSCAYEAGGVLTGTDLVDVSCVRGRLQMQETKRTMRTLMFDILKVFFMFN